MPVLGGKRIPPLAAVIPAATGTLALTVLWGTVAVSWWFTNGDGALSPPARMAVGVLYVPLAAWGPLLGAVTYSYYQRHRSGTKPEATRDVSLDREWSGRLGETGPRAVSTVSRDPGWGGPGGLRRHRQLIPSGL